MPHLFSSKQSCRWKFTRFATGFALCGRLMWICLACAGSALQAQTAQRIYELNNSFTETNGGSNIEPIDLPLPPTFFGRVKVTLP